MPHVQITWLRDVVRIKNEKLPSASPPCSSKTAKPSATTSMYHSDVPATNYAEAGVLVVDQKRTP